MKREHEQGDDDDDVVMLEVVGHTLGSEGKRYKVKCQVLGSTRTREMQMAPVYIPADLLARYESKRLGASSGQKLAAQPAPPGISSESGNMELQDPGCGTRGAMLAAPIIFSVGFIARRDAFVATVRAAVLAEAEGERDRDKTSDRTSIVQVRCEALDKNTGVMTLALVLDADSLSRTMRVGSLVRLSGSTSVDEGEEEWKMRVTQIVSPRVLRVAASEKKRPARPLGLTFTLNLGTMYDVTTQVRLGAINRLIGCSDCMSSPLMEMLMACDTDARLNAEHYASMAPKMASVRLPQSGADALLNSLGYRLNTSQRDAFVTAMRRSLTLVQGPPGTGKSYFAARMIAAVVAHNAPADGARRYPVLVVCESNSAVDNLLQVLDGLKVAGLVRVVSATQGVERNAIAEKYSLATMLKSHPGKSWRDDTRAVLRNASVVLATNTSSSKLLLWPNFEFCVMDEGSASNVSSALVPLTLGVRCLVVLGDHKQLSPFTSIQNKESESFFEMCIKRGVHRCLLDVQYRMHPSISAWPNRTFYEDRVRNDASVLISPVPSGFPWVGGERTLLFDVCGVEEQHNSSWRNKAEARVVAKIVAHLLKHEDLSVTIGVISFYAQQVNDIRNLCGCDRVTVDTVDSFQGHERDVIIVSTVRCVGRVGFLKDPRRWNVSITRSKRALIVVGHADTLRTDRCIGDWVRFMERRKLIVSGRHVTKHWPLIGE